MIEEDFLYRFIDGFLRRGRAASALRLDSGFHVISTCEATDLNRFDSVKQADPYATRIRPS